MCTKEHWIGSYFRDYQWENHIFNMHIGILEAQRPHLISFENDGLDLNPTSFSHRLEKSATQKLEKTFISFIICVIQHSLKHVFLLFR